MKMLFLPDEHGRYVRDRIERDLAVAAVLREARPPAQSIRQAIGHRIVRIGLKLAAEPSFESVRSR
jgi:hypothetical protein